MIQQYLCHWRSQNMGHRSENKISLESGMSLCYNLCQNWYSNTFTPEVVECNEERLYSMPATDHSTRLWNVYCSIIKKKKNLVILLTEHHTMKVYWGSGGIAPLSLWPRQKWSASRRLLYPHGKSPWYPLDRRLGGPQSCSWHGGEEKNSQPPPGIKP
jgi:hypothetical protein